MVSAFFAAFPFPCAQTSIFIIPFVRETRILVCSLPISYNHVCEINSKRMVMQGHDDNDGGGDCGGVDNDGNDNHHK